MPITTPTTLDLTDARTETRARPAIPPAQRLVRFGFQTLGRLAPRRAGRVALRLFCSPLRRARHRQSDALLEAAEGFTFAAGAHELRGYRWGAPDRPVILLAHGWESRGTALRHFVPALLARGYAVAAFDAVAHGDSPGTRTHLPEYAGALEALAAQLDDVAAIIGHSFGGASTIYALCRRGGTLRVPKLVLINSPCEMRWVFNDAKQQMGLPDAVFDEFIRQLQVLAGIPDVFALDDPALRAQLRAGATLVVHDELDPVIDYAQGYKNYTQLPNSQLLTTRGGGHFNLIKRPEVLERVADFIGPAAR